MPSLLEIEELISKGMVLDEHGKWIPLSEKVKKEREIISHLEKGEALFKGEWRKISEVKELIQKELKIKKEKEVAEEETAIINIMKTPEETVSFSTETIFDLPIKKSTEEKDDFPPETKIITFEIDKNDETSSVVLKKEEKRVDKSVPVSSEREVEFEETVLYDIEMLKKKIETEKKFHYRSYSDPEKIFSPYVAKKNKKQTIWPFLLTILSITVILIFFLLKI